MKRTITILTAFGVLAVFIFGLHSCKKKSVEIDFNYTGTLHAGYLITFHSNAGNAGSYLWTFGDGSKSTDPNPNHTYNSAATFVVTLTWNNDTSKKITKLITIDVPFDFTVSGTPAAGHSVNFSSNAPSGSLFAWNFGDGTTSGDATPTHTYSANGSYEASLILNNDSTHIIKKTISIFANAVYLAGMAGDRMWHHTYTNAYPWPPYHTTDTLADVSMAINFISPYMITIGNDTLDYYSSTSPYTSPDVVTFARDGEYPNIHNELQFNHSTSTLDYYKYIHISAGAGDANHHYYNY